MHFFDQSVARRCQDFKAAVWESIQDHKITQEDIAASLGVAQCAVSRWMSVTGDLHVPAALIPALNDEKVKPLQFDILSFIARQSGCVVTVRPEVVGELNGSLNDETLDLTAHLGRIADLVASGRMDAKKARREIASMRLALNKADAELEASNG